MSETVKAGVVGVGNMGSHHARVYSELTGVNLVGVNDADGQRARTVAEQFDVGTYSRESLLDRVDVVSIAVPTEYHHEIGLEAIDAGTHLLIEKPFVRDVAAGRELMEAAHSRDLVLQVGHIERYNPAFEALQDVMTEADPIAIASRRQGPPVDRDGSDDVVFDLMIHDIDIVTAIADAPVASISAMAVDNNPHVVAQFEFENGLIAALTGSRVTQERIRDLAITAEECQIDVDYMDQSVQIHRHSLPEYVVADGDVRYRHESIIERPTVENGEPLKNELAEFADAVRTGDEPRTSAADGLRAVELASRVEEVAKRTTDGHAMEVPKL
jgi:predicted dehydrogenase